MLTSKDGPTDISSKLVDLNARMESNHLVLLNAIRGMGYRVCSRIDSNGQKLDSHSVRIKQQMQCDCQMKAYVQWFKLDSQENKWNNVNHDSVVGSETSVLEITYFRRYIQMWFA